MTDSSQPAGTQPAGAMQETPHGANAVLTMSTISFTVMFAVWLMFGILGKPIQEEFGLTDSELSWISAVAILNGSMWRLPAGILTDRFGGRRVMLVIMVFSAVASLAVSFAQNYAMILVLAFLVGFAGNSFTSGTAWNSAWFPKHRQGFALGLFGAGNVGASATKFIGPVLIASTAGATYFGVIPGGWRIIPVIYTVVLLVLVVLMVFVTPRQDRMAGQGRPLGEMMAPLREVRVWRFSLYYVVVFGAYVALSAWLPKYYMDNFGVSLGTAGLLTATFIFPASLLRPLGGWISDAWGARRAMYLTFALMLVASGVLMMPNGHIVINHADGSATEHLAYEIGLVPFVLLVFLMACAMGIGKAAVYKHIPEYFPQNVGAVGGLVGMLGGLGGFILPPLFAYTKQWSGFPTSTFFVLFVLTAISMAWMHLTVVRMLHAESPELADHFERPPGDTGAVTSETQV
ncbi:MFS transporter [Propioniferax innocua]|uniref:NNP family nitrate/nitrite transporter-like MFS transporter n=1 Tax=Propioniferax innocua TaxID=1753 RepID=A0A542ZRR5_9ACTN|nr:MFS transporter [Propioniferax innocua]TQL62939.1 NNP family nitrate/nitrite transporter-like MFS transporter [Propioniferax innocua]